MVYWAVLTFLPCLDVHAQVAAFRNLVLHITVQPPMWCIVVPDASSLADHLYFY